MSSRGIWLTVLMRGCKLNLLTPLSGGTTALISYTQCYKIGGRLLQRSKKRSEGIVHAVTWQIEPVAFSPTVL
jgi:hypothetical protein